MSKLQQSLLSNCHKKQKIINSIHINVKVGTVAYRLATKGIKPFNSINSDIISNNFIDIVVLIDEEGT